MRYYPLFLDIVGRRCVVVGGGGVAERKVARLLACGAVVEVVAGSLTPALAALKAEGRIVHSGTEYAEDRLPGAFFVIGATDDGAVNERISRDARQRGILVNIVDDPARCDAILPALCERGELAIAVSTGGRSPALAKKLRTELEEAYGPEYGTLVEILGALREKVIARGGPAAENRKLFEAVVASDILAQIRAGCWDRVEGLIRELTGVAMEVRGR
ncbi:MAG: precorrin-2 dehydrogenase/sirohydrochlorin ferrochelatase family protein [Syntrophales bacterium]